MNKKIKILFIVIIIMSILSSTVLADGIQQTMKLIFDTIKLTIGDEEVETHSINYNDTVYIPLSTVEDILNEEILLPNGEEVVDNTENDSRNEIVSKNDDEKNNTNEYNVGNNSTSNQVTTESEFKFRNTKWGDTREEVIKSESDSPDLNNVYGLGYAEQSLAGYNSNLYYYFKEGKLYQAVYVIIEQHTNESKYIDDYEQLKELLIKKYGEPTNDIVYWYDDLYKDNPRSDWGMAIITGDLIYVSKWEVDNTTILLKLAGDNFEVDFTLNYVNQDVLDTIEEDTSGI